MTAPADVAQWRRGRRQDLMTQRMAVQEETLSRWQFAMDTLLERALPGWVGVGEVLAIYWPHRNEYDARLLASRLRAAGRRIALPVVTAPATPLLFRAWEEHTGMTSGPQGIPHPAAGPELIPDVVLAPALGFDQQGYRLGYGGGYFDRTLEALSARGRRPLAVATAYEMGRLETLYPQPHDAPMDYVLTERGLYRRQEQGLGLAPFDPD